MDAELIARARGGNPEALGSLYAQHAHAVMALAYRLLGSRSDAEDVLHDVFLGLPEALRQYEERGRFSYWVKRLAARAALTRLRTNSRRREVAMDATTEPLAPADDRSAERDALERALARLSPALRAVFMLKEVEGYSHAEIAELLDITTGASEVRLCRAIRLLRRELGDFT